MLAVSLRARFGMGASATDYSAIASIFRLEPPLNAEDEDARIIPLAPACAPGVRLVAAAGTGAETRITCRRVVTLLGSRDGCKVILRHGGVSPVHAAIVNNGTDVLAVDLITPQGTLLNELKMQHEHLRNGDVITVGSWAFAAEIHPPDPHAEGFHPFGLEPAPKVIALEHMATRRILQPTREICIIGRRQGCDIAISSVSVSRTHAILFTYFGFPAIFDLLSRNPTLVNDEPVAFKLLQDEDVVTIGESRFRMRLFGSPASEQASRRTDGVSKPVTPIVQAPAQDLIDIQTTEGSQRWRIVDNLEKVSRKRLSG